MQHAAVGGLRDGVDVRGHLVPLLAAVHLDDVLRVDGQVLVGVDDHAEQARVRLENKGHREGVSTWDRRLVQGPG